MLLKAFSVYDSKIRTYLPYVFYPHKGSALRAFEYAANDSSSNICKYPADHTLFEMGEFDDQTGAFVSLNAPINLGNAIEFKSNSGSAVSHDVSQTT